MVRLAADVTNYVIVRRLFWSHGDLTARQILRVYRITLREWLSSIGSDIIPPRKSYFYCFNSFDVSL